MSAVIPTYYRPDDLSGLLNSLLEQTVKPFEVIIVDDTPTAVIRHLCEDYEVKFSKMRVALIYVKNPKERSITISRNLGVRIATGDILLFLDSDVIPYSDYVEKVVETYGKYPEALGVAGWIVSPPTPRRGLRYCFIETLRKLFLLFHDSKNSCRYPEYPTILTQTTDCHWLSGATMSFKRGVFNEFQFDENLKGYAFMEDVLFSGSIRKRYPNRLLMTPYAGCIHKVSKEGRLRSSKRRYHKLQNRKYVLTRLFGSKGLLMFGWQNLGLLILRLIGKIRKWDVSASTMED